jgi:hypothetical protein
MKRLIRIALVLALALAPAIASANNHGKTPPGQRDGGNLGQLTREAIKDGFDQGAHASQQQNPRAGLANVVEQGDLSKTLDLIDPKTADPD